MAGRGPSKRTSNAMMWYKELVAAGRLEMLTTSDVRNYTTLLHNLLSQKYNI